MRRIGPADAAAPASACSVLFGEVGVQVRVLALEARLVEPLSSLVTGALVAFWLGHHLGATGRAQTTREPHIRIRLSQTLLRR
jgi:hypothetical protein